LEAYGLATAWNNDTKSGFLAWWCSGKILLTSISSLHTSGLGSQLHPIQLVAGNRDFASSGNAGHSSFAALQSSGKLIVDQLGSVEPDVPRQRVGIFVSRKFPHQGKIFIWYRDSENSLKMREVMIDGTVSAAVKLT
jgi:hypothetical protein